MSSENEPAEKKKRSEKSEPSDTAVAVELMLGLAVANSVIHTGHKTVGPVGVITLISVARTLLPPATHATLSPPD